MSAHEIAERHQEEQGWTDATLLDLCLDYIENQKSPEAFEDFLAESGEDVPAGGGDTKRCKFCETELHLDGAVWVDDTEGDCCSGDPDTCENENEQHVPEEDDAEVPG